MPPRRTVWSKSGLFHRRLVLSLRNTIIVRQESDSPKAEQQPAAALTLTWPQPDIALVTMIREREMNTLSLELFGGTR